MLPFCILPVHQSSLSAWKQGNTAGGEVGNKNLLHPPPPKATPFGSSFTASPEILKSQLVATDLGRLAPTPRCLSGISVWTMNSQPLSLCMQFPRFNYFSGGDEHRSHVFKVHRHYNVGACYDPKLAFSHVWPIALPIFALFRRNASPFECDFLAPYLRSGV
jgi:hypothetical protein